MLRRFGEKGPPASKVQDGRYGNRPIISLRNHFASMSAEIQKFYVALRRVRASNPTGVNEDDIASMAVAIHMGKTNKMDYEFKEYCKDNWVMYKAWMVLRQHPKWADVSHAESQGEPLPSGPNSSSFQQPLSSATPSNTDSDRDREASENSPTRGDVAEKRAQRFNTGIHKAKALLQEALRTQAVLSMAESAKRKTIALEEKNAILVFSQADAASLPETKQFCTALRRTYLTSALKRARLTSDEVGGVFVVNVQNESVAADATGAALLLQASASVPDSAAGCAPGSGDGTSNPASADAA